jgi:DNA (cytosine-5)-methyltransferase 1
MIQGKTDPLSATDYKDPPKINQHMMVRRLTPIECERLQGWPDNYTNVPLNGKPASDSARYKALGNGMAQPCARWLMQRVVDVLEQE